MAAQEGIPDEETYKQLTGSVFVGGAVSLTMSMAQQTGIVKTLMETSQPLSSQEIASQLKLKERYTREVLSSLAAMRLIQVEKGTGNQNGPVPRFFLPPQHREAFHKTACFTLINSIGGSRFNDIRACFPQDSPKLGLQYGESFFRGLSNLNEITKDALAETILKTPGLKNQLETGIRALEVGCGTANVSSHMAAMFPKTQFLLTDIVPQALDLARNNAKKQQLSNISFQILDIFEIPEDWHDCFDWVLVCDVIHDLPYPLKGLEGIKKVLKPGGHFSMLDMFMSTDLSGNIGNPTAAALYAHSTFFCVPESYQKPDSKALGACWGKQKARELVEKAGLRVIDLIDSMPESPGVMALCMCQKPSD